jgi:hypothetical protein
MVVFILKYFKLINQILYTFNNNYHLNMIKVHNNA